MNQRRLVAVMLVVVVALVAFVLWFATRPDAAVDAPKEAPPVAVGTVAEAAAPKKKAARRETASKWVRLGKGTVVGVVREYGSEKPFGGVEVTLEAGLPGPNEVLRAKTAPDGGFAFADVTNFDGWVLRVAAPAPFADTELAGVVVVENRQTSLGAVYLAPAFVVPGVVVDERDAPVAGAVVRAIRARPASSAMDVLRLIRELPARPVAVDSATSGDDGKFEMNKVPPGRYDFTVEKAGYQIRVETGAIVTPEAKSRPFKFVLVHGFQVDGVVVRASGGPVGGISVVAFHQPNNEANFNVLDKSFATTDEKGAFRVDGLGAGRYVVAVTPEGEPSVAADDVTVPTKKTVEIVLKGDAWLEGKVTGDADKPIVDAQIYAIDFSNRSPTIGNAKTDPDGRYVIRGLKSGPLQMFLVQAEGYGNYPDDVMALMRGGRGGKTDVVLVAGKNEKNVSLAKGGVVRGIVKEKESDAPISGARVNLGSMLAMFGGAREVTTGPDGKFEITSVPKGTAVLMVSKEGWYQPGVNAQSVMMILGSRMQSGASPGKDTGKGATIVISEPGEVVERTLELAHGSSISGLVTSPDGQPVAGAQVSLAADDSAGGGGMTRALAGLFPSPEPRLTDAQGHYEIPGPAPGEKARVAARATGWLDGKSDVLTCAAGDAKTGVDVRLRQGATLAGRVKDDKGKPVENALVRWTALGTDTNDWSIRWRLRAATPTVTDSKGEFRMTNVETGKLVVEAYDARHLPWMKRDVVAEDGKTVELEATLQLGLVIDGRVVDVDGKPRSGATVDWSRKFGDGQQRDPYQESNGRATSDAAGAFRIEGLPAGQYELTASAPGVAPSEPQTLDAGGAAVTLQLTQAFSITGFVRTKSGAPLADVEVALSKRVSGAGAVVAKPGSGTQESSRTVKRATTGPEGEFELKDVPGGTYELRAAAPSFRPGAKANILPTVVKDVPAGRQGLVVEVDAGLTISGAVYGEDGKLVVEGWVWANPADPKAGGEASGSQIEAGRFELVGLLPVKYRINVDGPGGQRKTVVAEAGTKDLRIEFGGGGSLRVRVTVDGAATAGVRVSASNDAGSGQGVTDADGACEIKSLSEGSYSVQAFHRVGETALRGVQEGVSVRAGGPTDVELRLEKVVPK